MVLFIIYVRQLLSGPVCSSTDLHEVRALVRASYTFGFQFQFLYAWPGEALTGYHVPDTFAGTMLSVVS